MDQQQQQPYKHYCRICKKGFGCGRALGGHMRAHGINEHLIGGHVADPDADPSAGGEWDGKLSPPDGSKRMYAGALRENPNRLKSCRVCENCGMEFLSWKPFLEHGKCRPEEEGDDSPPSSPIWEGDEEDAGGKSRGCAGWSKGKRSRRTKVEAVAGTPITACPSSEEEDLANCLVMLSAARVDPMAVVETEESCASASKEEDRRHTMERAAAAEKAKATVRPVPRGMFECKACKKVFNTHQALGGHRASHKKVKGCFAAKLDDLDEPPPEEEATTHGGRRHPSNDVAAEMALAIVPFHNPPLAVAPLRKKAKVHECSICHRVFASGQALGGHKRCHWITSSYPEPAATAKLRPMQDHAGHHHPRLMLRPSLEPSEPLDLNLPAPADDPAGVRPDVGSSYRLEVPATLCLQPWTDQSNGRNNNKNSTATAISNSMKNKNVTSNADVVDDEADSTIKRAKLTELKDVSIGSDASSNWLQVGIGSSSTNEGGDPA